VVSAVHGEADHMVQVNSTYAPKGLQFVGISLDNDVQAMRKVAQEKGFSWPQLCDAKSSVAAQMWGVSGIPSTFIIGPEGDVLWHAIRGARQAAGGCVQESSTATG